MNEIKNNTLTPPLKQISEEDLFLASSNNLQNPNVNDYI